MLGNEQCKEDRRPFAGFKSLVGRKEELQREEPAVGTTQQAQKAAHAQWILPLQGQSFSYLHMLSAFHSHPIEFMK